MRKLTILVISAAATVLVAATGASATHGPPPWTGGLDVDTRAEQRVGAVASEIARRPGSTGHCMTPDEWAAIAAREGADPAGLYAFVPFFEGGPADFMFIGPQICGPIDEFLGRPARDGQKRCRTGTTTEYRTQQRTQRYPATVRKRVKVGGKWQWKRVRVWRTRQVTSRVAVAVPVYGECATYRDTVFALQTIAHEATHIGGVRDEAAAECFGMQLTPLVAFRFGATEAFAFEIGADYLPLYIEFTQASPAYQTAHCYDGGPLDLFPSQTGWPTPSSRKALATPLRQLLAFRAPAGHEFAPLGPLPK